MSRSARRTPRWSASSSRALHGGVTAIRDMAGDARILAFLARGTRIGEIAGPDIYYRRAGRGPELSSQAARMADEALGRGSGAGAVDARGHARDRSRRADRRDARGRRQRDQDLRQSRPRAGPRPGGGGAPAGPSGLVARRRLPDHAARGGRGRRRHALPRLHARLSDAVAAAGELRLCRPAAARRSAADGARGRCRRWLGSTRRCGRGASCWTPPCGSIGRSSGCARK